MSDQYTIIQSSYLPTYEVSPYTDWQSCLASLPSTSDKTILELGLGLGTRILLDKFSAVYSFEVVKTDEWYKKSVNDYKHYTNWKHEFHFMSEFGLDIADEWLLQSGGITRNVKPMKMYFEALEKFVPTINSMDVAFVDQGFHFRGEAVNYFLQKQIPIIIAHDTYNHDQIYGYDRVVMPENYTKETFGGLGTTVYTRQ